MLAPLPSTDAKPQTRGGEILTKLNVMKYLKKEELDTLIVAVGYKYGSTANIRGVKMASWSPKKERVWK